MRVTTLLTMVAACGSSPVTTDGGLDGSELPDTPPSSATLEAADVSFLFPLPDSTGLGSLVAMDANAAGGTLFARSHYEAFSPIRESAPDDEYAILRVTSVRLDPCAAIGASDCAPVVRLVVQVLEPDAQGKVSAHDGAFHLFYAVAPAELSALAYDVRVLKGRAGATSGALSPHAALAAGGLDGDYAASLRALVLRYTGDDRLFRVAEMTMALGQEWDFAIFDRTPTGWARQPIPRVGANFEQVFDDSTSTTRILRLAPAPSDPSLAILLDSTRWTTATDPEWTSAIAGALRVDNPELTRVADTDCAACHVSTRARRAGLLVRPIDVGALPERFDAGGLVSGDESGDRAEAVMAFAYLRRQAMVTDRTLNDSIVSARRFDAIPWR